MNGEGFTYCGNLVVVGSRFVYGVLDVGSREEVLEVGPDSVLTLIHIGLCRHGRSCGGSWVFVWLVFTRHDVQRHVAVICSGTWAVFWKQLHVDICHDQPPI